MFVRLFLLATALTLHRRAPGGSAVLTRRREEFTTIHERTRGVIDAAAGAENGTGRDLTEAELAAVEADRTRAEALAVEIEQLVEDEIRAARVAAGYAEIGGQQGTENAGGGDENRGEHDTSGSGGGTGNASTQDRDPGHYRSVAEGGENSFFADLVRGREGDTDAQTRLQEHNRALSTGVAGAGIVPPRWLIEEYEALARQGRVAAELVRRIEITNPAPMTLQRQTTGTDNVLAQQATENTHPSETDAFATTVDVVTPKPISGIQVVSRQMIDMTNPAADNLIYGDMLSVYNRKIEDSVTAALVTAAGTPVSPMATEAAFLPGAGPPPTNPAEDAITDCAIAVWNGRKLPADVVLMRTSRWGRFMKFRDNSGRRLYPAEGEMVNISGRGSVQVPGTVGGLAVGVTDGLGIGIGAGAPAGYPESIIVFRSADTILFEGNMLRFRYEEVAGPESVKLGVWAYSAVIVRQAAFSVRRTQITAA
jgi:HK97 family phage major capsid protein